MRYLRHDPPSEHFARTGAVLAVAGCWPAAGVVLRVRVAATQQRRRAASDAAAARGQRRHRSCRSDVRQWDEFTGRVTAVETVELRPRVSGYVERVAYEEGQEVRKGDLLFVIDQRRYRAALDQARRGPRARTQRSAARGAREDARAQTLIEAKAISREEFDAPQGRARAGQRRACAPPKPPSTARGSTCSSPRCARRSTAAPAARW